MTCFRVANATVQPPNWATLKSPAGGLLFFIGLLFLSICPQQLFFYQICQFSVNSECFWTFLMSKKIINFEDQEVLESNQYILSTSHRGQQSNCFSTQLVIFINLILKAPKFGKLSIWLLNKNWATLMSQKIKFAAIWCSEILQHWFAFFTSTKLDWSTCIHPVCSML